MQQQKKIDMKDINSLLEEIGELPVSLVLSKSQQNAMDIFKTGANMCVMGCAGTGKSKVIENIRGSVEQEGLFITATTGVAAVNINGITFHSWAGIGTGDGEVRALVSKIFKGPAKDRIQSARILVIDEISMMSAELFEKLDLVFQKTRGTTKFFGGIQLVVLGDFLQLLPVFKDTKYKKYTDKRLVFESDVFKKNLKIITLKTNFRQSDNKFIELLDKIRNGVVDEMVTDTLKSRMSDVSLNDDPKVVTLVSSNASAQIINSRKLEEIKEKSHFYRATFTKSGFNKAVLSDLEHELSNQLKQRGIDYIELKKGARVMLLKNIDVPSGLVNGATGTVIDFIGNSPTVLFDNGSKMTFSPVEWTLEYGNCKITAKQIPLFLAYALTYHKSQGLTLAHAKMDLASCFTYSQVYVGLSRMSSIEGLHITSFDPKKVICCESAKQFMEEYC